MRWLFLGFCVALSCGGSDGVILDGGGDSPINADATADSSMSDSAMDGTANDSGGDAADGSDAGSCPGTCATTPPMGWNFLAYDDMNRDPCPANYGNPIDAVENATGAPAACGCTCSVQNQPACVAASPTMDFANNNQCNMNTQMENLNVTCGAQAITYTNGNATTYGVGKSLASPMGGSCNNPMVSKSVPPPNADLGRFCAITGPTSSCQNGTCVPIVSGSYGLCIQHDGDQACPNGYPNKHIVGVGINDTRDCSVCTCTLGAKCNIPVAHFYVLGGCMGNATSLTLDGTCQVLGQGTFTSASNQTTATLANSACDKNNNFGPVGAVDLKQARTVCCQ